MTALAAAAKKAAKETDKSLERVNKALALFVASSDVGIRDATRKVTGDILAGVARRTPVHTGRLRAGWTPGFRRLGAKEPPMPAVSRTTGEPVVASEIAKGRRQGRARIRSEKDTYEITIHNGARYGPFVETGLVGRQARRGMVRITLREQSKALVRAAKKVRPKGAR